MSTQAGQPSISAADVLTELHPLTDPGWDDFVLSHPASTVYHHSAWTQVLAETYGHTPFYLGLRSTEGSLRGVLPFVFVNSPFTGRRVVSLPFTTYCNPLLPAARLDEALRYAFERFPGAGSAELKRLEGSDGIDPLDVPSPFVTQVLSLTGDTDDLFRSFHDSCVRRRIRHAEKSGLTFRLAETEPELRRLYQLLAEVRRGQGLPIFPYRFFSNMRRRLMPLNLCELAVIELGGQVVAAAVILKGRSTWHLEYIASDAGANRLGPNQLLLWECIKRAHLVGAKVFDFGRTSLAHESLLEFKDRWNTVRRPIYQRLYPAEKTSRPSRDTSRSLLRSLNRRLPSLLLKWEGQLLYPHRS